MAIIGASMLSSSLSPSLHPFQEESSWPEQEVCKIAFDLRFVLWFAKEAGKEIRNKVLAELLNLSC